MNIRLIILHLVSFWALFFGTTRVFSHNPAEENTIFSLQEIKSIIDKNDEGNFRGIICQISQADSASRDFEYERQILNYVIDSLNPRLALICLQNKIGYTSNQQNYLPPFEYLYDDNIRRRIINAKTDILSKDVTVGERLQLLSNILLGYYTSFTEEKLEEINQRLMVLKSENLDELIKSH